MGGARRSIAALLLVSSAMLSLAAPVRAGERHAAEDRRPLKMVIAPFLSFAPILIARDEGFFEDAGLDIEFVTMNRSSDAVPLLVQGRIDVLATALFPSHVNAIARGGRIRLVADKGFFDPAGCAYGGLVASRSLVDSGRLDSPDGLRGLRVTTERSSWNFYVVGSLLESSGLTIDDVRVVDIPQSAKARAFEDGAVDIASASEPWLTIITDVGDAVLWKPYHDIVPGFQMGTILFGPTLLGDDPEAGVRFLVGYLRGVRQYLEGKTERNVEILARWTKLEPDLVRRACWIPVHADATIDTASVLDYERWALGEGLIDRIVPAVEFCDPSFLEQAADRLAGEEDR